MTPVRLALLCLAAVAAPAAAQALPGHGLAALPPDSAGVPTRVLATADGSHSRWYGTYGRGILVRELSPGACSACFAWRQLAHRTSDSASISFDFVNAIAFGNKGEIWYGTVGNGWGRSLDNGRTWKNWEFAQLGPEWQYVAPNGIVIRGDTVVIGTADGLQVTTDDGAHWVAIGDTVGPPAKGPADTAIEVLSSEYVYGVKADRSGWIVRRLHGTTVLNLAGCLRRAHGEATAPCVVRAVLVRLMPPSVAGLTPARGPLAGSAKRWAPWFARPIATEDNDFIDQTYRWGSTMGGAFQAHQGVEFNNPDGTPVHAIGDGTVVYAGRAEGGALTIGIRHDTMLAVDGRKLFVFSAYYHNSALLVNVGDRVKRGEVISRVGNTGRATNDHLHLEVHAAPTDSVHAIIDSLNRYPTYVTNPELWIAPLPGTGVIAGTVTDGAGKAIPQARVYGIRKPLPTETPFAYAETYGPHNRPHPLYGEQFAISDVPAGVQHLFVVIDGKRIARTVVVRAGAMSWVEFRP
jgi:murein DD-endopeptidase MepM/ murein hydrolase activator NlpD